jgi:hypothetical protein
LSEQLSGPLIYGISADPAAAAKVLNAPTPKHMTAAEGSELLLGGSDDDWRTTDPTWQTPTE